MPLIPAQVPELGRQRAQIVNHLIWPVVGVDVTDESIPFLPSEYTIRIVDLAHQTSVLMPFDRQGLERLRIAITAALDSHMTAS